MEKESWVKERKMGSGWEDFMGEKSRGGCFLFVVAEKKKKKKLEDERFWRGLSRGEGIFGAFERENEL